MRTSESERLPEVVTGNLPMSAEQVRDHVNAIQKIMEAVMKRDTHYGIIPGAKKPSLYKPGAETLCKTFHIEPSFQVEDLSTADCYRYRVRCVGTHQGTGIKLGEGMGAASSNEEKYKWRRAVCAEEWDAIPESRRRLKFSSYEGKTKKVMQVRTEPDDIDNTVLKMACKRAQVAMTLNVVAASDIFAQDIEDLPEHLRDPDNTQDGTATAQGGNDVPPYSVEAFTKNLPAWTVFIESGKKTADEIIAIVSSKGQLSDEQKTTIRAIKATTKGAQ